MLGSIGLENLTVVQCFLPSHKLLNLYCALFLVVIFHVKADEQILTKN